ncbi:hypothetical protein [Burkholderia ubonensis]|uniref:hypothetical protein n=1 Tax=Burkholderia ubonensis TaxID=101571 RepID=UPI00016A5602|nr:hypothetical protein [Burkholderia ubonensis]
MGKLQAPSIWRCLANRGAKVRRVRIDVDLDTGIESKNVDIVESLKRRFRARSSGRLRG